MLSEDVSREKAECRAPRAWRSPTPRRAGPIQLARRRGHCGRPEVPPRGERLVFRCEPSTAGVVWLIAAPAFSLSRENQLLPLSAGPGGGCHKKHRTADD